MTNYSRSVLLSNGLPHPKIQLKKFGFSSKPIPTNIVKKLPSRRCSKPIFSAFFNFSHERPTFAFTSESGHTLGSRRKIAHNGSHGETWAVSDGGRYLYPWAVPHVRKPPRAGCQNGELCRFWVLAGGALKEHRKPAEQRCAYVRRCSEASRPRWAA